MDLGHWESTSTVAQRICGRLRRGYVVSCTEDKWWVVGQFENKANLRSFGLDLWIWQYFLLIQILSSSKDPGSTIISTAGSMHLVVVVSLSNNIDLC